MSAEEANAKIRRLLLPRFTHSPCSMSEATKRPAAVGVLLALLVLVVACSWIVVPVAGEGAGESLADAAVCLGLIQELQASPVFLLGESEEIVVGFNGTLYGGNGTIYYLLEPEPGNETLSLNLTAAGPLVDNTVALGNESFDDASIALLESIVRTQHALFYIVVSLPRAGFQCFAQLA
eukprot:scaffold371862_cov43-Prasinocladus_malaysianus.AAC.2